MDTRRSCCPPWSACEDNTGDGEGRCKLRLPKILVGVGRKTIQRIIQVRLDIPSVDCPKVPFLTEEEGIGDVEWATISGRRTISDWRGVLFADECPFHRKQTTGGRRVRRPWTANKYDPKYTRPAVRKPDMIIFWGGIAASATWVHGFFQHKEKFNSKSYMSMK